jgi:GMP synthase-like glutamine amidotransferase
MNRFVDLSLQGHRPPAAPLPSPMPCKESCFFSNLGRRQGSAEPMEQTTNLEASLNKLVSVPMRKTILFLDCGGAISANALRLEKLVRTLCDKDMKDTDVKTVPLFGTFPATADVCAIVISGSSIVPLCDMNEKGAATTWLMSGMARFPKAHVWGVCFGMQVLASIFGGKVADRPDGFRRQNICVKHDTSKSVFFEHLPQQAILSVSHRHFVSSLPPNFQAMGVDNDGQLMAMGAYHGSRHIIGVQYHAEAVGSDAIGATVLAKFLQAATGDDCSEEAKAPNA